jgi:hypothetical protein
LIALRARSWLTAALLLLCGAGAAAAQSPPIGITVGSAAAEWRPFLRVNGLLLEDRALREALGSGLPLRLHFRLELWERAFLDRLVATEEASLALVQEPLERTYVLSDGHSNHTYATLTDAERGIARSLPSSLRPRPRGGRYYYLATLEVETLSLSDLEELQRWLRGEARPAIQGRAPVARALGRGVQRAMVRMIGLPSRRYEVRSPTFTVE